MAVDIVGARTLSVVEHALEARCELHCDSHAACLLRRVVERYAHVHLAVRIDGVEYVVSVLAVRHGSLNDHVVALLLRSLYERLLTSERALLLVLVLSYATRCAERDVVVGDAAEAVEVGDLLAIECPFGDGAVSVELDAEVLALNAVALHLQFALLADCRQSDVVLLHVCRVGY